LHLGPSELYSGREGEEIMEWVNAHPEWKAKEADPVEARPQAITAAPATMGFWKIAFAVMVGNLMFGILAAIVYSTIRNF
jgi:hypothetical protein